MIRDRNEIVSVRPVRVHDLLRRQRPVGVRRMGVQVATKEATRLLKWELVHTFPSDLVARC
jgi:hypothetical protein